MTKKAWSILPVVLLGTIILTNLPFLPGPSILYVPSHLFYNGGQMLGLFGLIVIPIGIILAALEFKKTKVKPRYLFFYSLLWTVPLTLFLSTNYISNLTRNWSRTIAINRANELIHIIEAYKKTNGQYPEKLENLGISKPWTGIIGIPGYSYQKNQNNFNLSFTQNVILNFNYEVVTYDRTNSHKAEGELKEMYDTGQAHWKYYVFD